MTSTCHSFNGRITSKHSERTWCQNLLTTTDWVVKKKKNRPHLKKREMAHGLPQTSHTPQSRWMLFEYTSTAVRRTSAPGADFVSSSSISFDSHTTHEQAHIMLNQPPWLNFNFPKQILAACSIMCIFLSHKYKSWKMSVHYKKYMFKDEQNICSKCTIIFKGLIFFFFFFQVLWVPMY